MSKVRAEGYELNLRRDYRRDELARDNKVHIHQVCDVRKLSSCAPKVGVITAGDLMCVCELEGKAIGAN